MIVIDGRECIKQLSDFANLEDALVKLVESENLSTRLVTDVFVNDEAFSELYPHQAEDIPIEDVKRLELHSVSAEEMAKDIVDELPKVIQIIASSSKNIAMLFRQSELDQALELLQDMVSVGSDFIKTLQVLRYYFSGNETAEILQISETLSSLISEVTDAMEDEDWMLVADLLEFEFSPATQGWAAIIDSTKEDVYQHQA